MILKLGILYVGCGALAAWAGEHVFSVDFSKRAQQIEHIGSSTGMHGDYISKHWKTETVDAISDLLFSRTFDEQGSPKGIGLSSFRIQIGAGAEGEAGGIKAPWRRTECFLQPDGSYDWESRDQGVHYWRNQCEDYEVPVVMGYLNSPPVQFTESGYVFKTEKTFTSNLKPEHYNDYATFIAEVAAHFQSLEKPFSYISPVNEPQWFWDGIPGRAKQEGTPWTNEQIARLVRLTDKAFKEKQVQTRLLIPEAAEYDVLYAALPEAYFAAATDQVSAFWNRKSPDYLGNLQTVEKAVAGHAYFSDGSINKIMHTRESVKKAVQESDTPLRFWQTEYCLLGNGWTGGQPVREVGEIEAALLLARTIHADLTLADATVWQWWSSTEPKMGRVPRYCLIECGDDDAQSFRATRLLWALGNYSSFVRPGMVRVEVCSDETVEQSLQEVMASAYYDEENSRWVAVLINFSDEEQKVVLRPHRLPEIGSRWTSVGFLTDSTTSLGRFPIVGNQFTMPSKSLVTVVVGKR